MSDKHGNTIAQEGVTVCACGCKYWERDRCIDCGAAAPSRLFTEEHKLTTSSTGARSHSGWDYTGRCTCGEWSRTYGDHSGFSPTNRLREDHAAHVKEVTK